MPDITQMIGVMCRNKAQSLAYISSLISSHSLGQALCSKKTKNKKQKNTLPRLFTSAPFLIFQD